MQKQPQNTARSLQVTFAFEYGELYGDVAAIRPVRRPVRRGVRRGEGKETPAVRCSSSSGLPPSFQRLARRAAALALKNSVQASENSPLAQPICPLRALAEIRKWADARGWELETGLRALAQMRFQFPAARSAPTHRPFPSLALGQGKAGGSARFALGATLRSRLGALPCALRSLALSTCSCSGARPHLRETPLGTAPFLCRIRRSLGSARKNANARQGSTLAGKRSQPCCLVFSGAGPRLRTHVPLGNAGHVLAKSGHGLRALAHKLARFKS
ncbi:MAG TPA: hypothetical protein VFK06_24720 [Candidatus Angelobacter sp.]|nr:hypothetical protein [Candidatus Angelobacter sp.]